MLAYFLFFVFFAFGFLIVWISKNMIIERGRKMNRCIVDFLTFSIRKDEHSKISLSEPLDFDFICRFLGLPAAEFSNMGRIKYYKERYECNNISIAVPFEARETQQGYNISMSGNGCRYYESYIKQGEMIDVYDIWRGLFKRLRALTEKGFSVNVSRLDIAVDDFSGVLTVDKVVKCIENDCVATRFQRRVNYDGNCDMYIAQSAVKTSFFRRIRSSTAEFGSRLSRSFCRIYDKKAEQMQKNYNDKKEFARLEKMKHWTRFEVEFKDENAIKMVNAFIDQLHFPHFFASYVNGMLRFIERDNSNISRCHTCSWWAEFIGTTCKTSMSCGDYRPVTVKRHLDYVHKKLSGAIYAAINCEGLDDFLNHVISFAQMKLSPKHQRLCGGIEDNIQNLCSADLWNFLKPHSLMGSASNSEYYYTDGALASC